MKISANKLLADGKRMQEYASSMMEMAERMVTFAESQGAEHEDDEEAGMDMELSTNRDTDYDEDIEDSKSNAKRLALIAVKKRRNA